MSWSETVVERGLTAENRMEHYLRRAGIAWQLGLLMILLWAGTALVQAQESEGVVKFYVDAKSDFDQWSSSPSQEQKAKMRQYYHRIQGYSSYWDSRLDWFPDSWDYEDAFAIKPGWQVFQDNPEFVLRDAQGNLLYIPYGCSGGTCPQYAGDIGNPAFRSWWINNARSAYDQGYIGIFIDDVNLNVMNVGNGAGDRVPPIDPRTGEEMTLSDWRRYFAEFLEEIRAAYPNAEIAHNLLYWAPLSDPYVERARLAADYAALERGISDSGINGGTGTYGFETVIAFIEWMHARGRNVIMDDDDDTSDEMRDYDLAFYYLINDGNDMLSADGDRSRMNPDDFWSGYQLDLGFAIAGHYRWQQLFRRDFECGMVLVNQPDMPTISVNLGGTYTNLEGQNVTTATLGAARGTVLRTTCETDPPPKPPSNLHIEDPNA